MGLFSIIIIFCQFYKIINGQLNFGTFGVRHDPYGFNRNRFQFNNQQRSPDLLTSIVQNFRSIFRLPPQNILTPLNFFPQSRTQSRFFTQSPPTFIPLARVDENQFPPAVGKGWDSVETASTKSLTVDGLEEIQLPKLINDSDEIEETEEDLSPDFKIPQLKTKSHITTEGRRRNDFEKKSESGVHDGGTGGFDRSEKLKVPDGLVLINSKDFLKH